MFNLTKRQLICFTGGALIGVPLFFLLRKPTGNSVAAMCMMLVMLPFSILVFGILGALEVIDNTRMIVLYLSGYLLFQVIAGIVIFNKLMKKY